MKNQFGIIHVDHETGFRQTSATMAQVVEAIRRLIEAAGEDAQASVNARRVVSLLGHSLPRPATGLGSQPGYDNP